MTSVTAQTRTTPSETRHDPLTITLHWITAFLVLFQFFSAQVWEFLEKGTAGRLGLIYTHFAFGILLTVVVLVRVVWRIAKRNHLSAATSGIKHLAAQAVHLCLYALLLTQVALGLAFGWSSGKPIPFFNLFSVPPIVTFDPSYRHQIAGLHNDVAWIIIAFVAIHAFAALAHHYILRDKVLMRMMPAR